MIMEKLFDVH